MLYSHVFLTLSSMAAVFDSVQPRLSNPSLDMLLYPNTLQPRRASATSFLYLNTPWHTPPITAAMLRSCSLRGSTYNRFFLVLLFLLIFSKSLVVIMIMFF